MREVQIGVRSPALLTGLVSQERLTRLLTELVPDLKSRIGSGRVINVNTTDAGGGVAEMLHVLLPLASGAGIPAQWFVMNGDAGFFEITKRLHHRLHGALGDGGPLSTAEQNHFCEVTRHNAQGLLAHVEPSDVVILHDPQTAGLAKPLREAGIPVIWRCHIGVDQRNEYTADGWGFLEPMLAPFVQQYVFTRLTYAPSWAPKDRVNIIHPAIDPLAVKNRELTPDQVLAILQHAGMLAGEPPQPPEYVTVDGSLAPYDLRASMITDGVPSSTDPLVVQVSRWDPLKDMTGVMAGFVRQAERSPDAHLMLVGPTAVADDPESGVVLETVRKTWQGLPDSVRRRVHLAVLPMDDPVQNAATVNAIQRQAVVVVQKSLAEGFGLTVTEAMYKCRPVIASDVGGIRDQITDGVTGWLLADPTDLDDFADVLAGVLADSQRAAELGAAAQAAAVDRFLPDTSLSRWYEVVRRVAAPD